MGSLACTAPLFTAHFHKRLGFAATVATVATVLVMFHFQLKTCPAHPRAVTFLGTTLTMHMYKVLS